MGAAELTAAARVFFFLFFYIYMYVYDMIVFFFFITTIFLCGTMDAAPINGTTRISQCVCLVCYNMGFFLLA